MVERPRGPRGQLFLGRHGWGKPFHRGDFKYIVLQCIKDKPSYGYEIIRQLQERFANVYTPSPGSVYPTLQMLDEMGYAKSSEREGKKVYAITEEGSKFLDSQKEFEERMKNPERKWWKPDHVKEIMETRHQFEKLALLIREKAHTADVEKLGRIRKTLSSAYDEISKE
jgi:DNA-binding PadR family transcriptional regulator